MSRRQLSPGQSTRFPRLRAEGRGVRRLESGAVRILVWALRAFVFFTLFAFALNNQHTVTVHWFFGAQWSAPMVIIVLVVFAAGCGIGALVLLPGWWRQRRAARHAVPRDAAVPPAAEAPLPTPGGGGALVPVHPPRDGL